MRYTNSNKDFLVWHYVAKAPPFFDIKLEQKSLFSRGLYYKTFHSRNFRIKLECLSLARLSSQV